MNLDQLLDATRTVAAPSSDVLDRGRVAAIDGMTADLQHRARVVRMRRRRRVLTIGAVAAAATGLVLLPPLVTDDAVALVPIDPFTFGVTASWLPADLPRDASFRLYPEDDAGKGSAVYGDDVDGKDGVRISIHGPDEFQFSEPPPMEDVDIAGRPGRGWSMEHQVGSPESAPTYTIEWEQVDGDFVSVMGIGTYANRATVERIADSVIDKPQPVDFGLTIAPQGDGVGAYISGHHISYGSGLTLHILDRLHDDISELGAREIEQVTINGRPGEIGFIPGSDEEGGWLLQSTTADGQAYSINGPKILTKNQMLEIAASVKHG